MTHQYDLDLPAHLLTEQVQADIYKQAASGVVDYGQLSPITELIIQFQNKLMEVNNHSRNNMPAESQKAVHLPDVYRAALEQVDTLLEAGSPKEPSETLYVAQSNLYVLRLHVAEARKLILEALGGVDEVMVFINGSEKLVPVELSFEDIVVLAFDEGARESSPTVLYSRAFGGRSGVLIKGKSVRVTNGTRISVAFTGSA